METYIKEENFFKCLTWVCHTLCGLCISILVGDNFLFNEYDSSIIHRSCAKIPKCIIVEHSTTTLFFNKMYVCVHLVLVFVGIGINIAIFLKQRQLESQESCWRDCFVTFDKSDVNIIRKSKQPRILWRFRRNVVSPLASFSSFIASVLYNFPAAYIFLNITSNGPSVLGDLYLFSFHCVYFLWLNLIESIFSPTLRSSLLNVLPINPWFRHEYHAVVV